MQISIAKEKILDALQHIQSVITNKSTLPILNNVHIDAREAKLSLSATDLQVSIKCQIEAEVKKAGSTTLPARRIFTIFRELSQSEINLDVDSKDVCSVRSGQSYFKILGLPAVDYPAMPVLDNPRQISMPQAALKDLLRKTSYAISTDETRYVLNGVLFSLKDNTITIVATDGRRLALAEVEQEFPQSAQGEVIIPTKAVNELLRLLRESGEVKISISENQISFEMNNITLYSKLTEGNYPNYRQVIPTEARDRVTLEREAFNNMVRRVSIMTSEKSSSVKLHLSKDNITLSATSPELGEARESQPIKYNGRDLTIAFNPQYLQDPLRNLDSDEINFDFVDELSPGVMRTNSPGFLYVIMPMRVA
jgi:DNA polymerase-3 subunit beta